MQHPRRFVIGSLILAAAAGGAGAAGMASGAPAARSHGIDPGDFTRRIDNPYLPLKPGTVYHYKSSEPGVTNAVRVTHRTKRIVGVKCREVNDLDKVHGKRDARSLDWYAQDDHGNVWYFGEATSDFKHGHWVRNPDDSWRSGVRGARPGIIMEAHPRKGDRYRQEVARRDHALDTARVLGYRRTVRVAYGTFHHVLKIKEFSPLEPGVIDHDSYARGIGEIKEVNVKGGEGKSKLVSISH